MQMSTTHSSFDQYRPIALVTKLLVIEQLLHPAPTSTVSAPWHKFNLCPSSQQILATPLGAVGDNDKLIALWGQKVKGQGHSKKKMDCSGGGVPIDHVPEKSFEKLYCQTYRYALGMGLSISHFPIGISREMEWTCSSGTATRKWKENPLNPSADLYSVHLSCN